MAGFERQDRPWTGTGRRVKEGGEGGGRHAKRPAAGEGGRGGSGVGRDKLTMMDAVCHLATNYKVRFYWNLLRANYNS